MYVRLFWVPEFLGKAYSNLEEWSKKNISMIDSLAQDIQRYGRPQPSEWWMIADHNDDFVTHSFHKCISGLCVSLKMYKIPKSREFQNT